MYSMGNFIKVLQRPLLEANFPTKDSINVSQRNHSKVDKVRKSHNS